ncbi:MAG TPA: DUF63 family protein [Thermoplasmatales archaeon]|nr:DUF63 family protein [Thermoplasmatales archaeon]
MRRWLLPVGVGAAALTAALLVAPEVVYDRFIWKYFVGPVVADAVGRPVSHRGVEAVEGYTLLSEMVYGAILLAMFYLLYRVFRHFSIRPDLRFFVGASPFLLLGATLRVLEDSGLFSRPLAYLFISPLIYAQIGFYFAVGIAAGLLVQRKKNPGEQRRLLVLLLAGVAASYTLAHLMADRYLAISLHPLWMVAFATVALGAFYLWKNKDMVATLFSLGTMLVLPSLYFIAVWMAGERWGTAGEVHLAVIPLVLVLTLAGVLGVYALGRWRRLPWLTAGVNLSLVFGHLIDGWTSYLAVVDPLGMGISYGEKHPLPLFLMEAGNGIAYPLAKMAVALIIIYGTDVYLRQDLAERPILTGLIKFFVLILGLSPGLRDMLRILMGT